MFMDLDQLAATIHHIQHVAGYPGEPTAVDACKTHNTGGAAASVTDNCAQALHRVCVDKSAQ
jgi:hypothetical protein